jgi:hypothetical protein
MNQSQEGKWLPVLQAIVNSEVPVAGDIHVSKPVDQVLRFSSVIFFMDSVIL